MEGEVQWRVDTKLNGDHESEIRLHFRFFLNVA